MKNLWLHNNQLTSLFPAGQPQQYMDTLLPNSLHVIYLHFLLLIIILFKVFYFFFSISANLIKAKTLQESEKNNY